MAIRAPDGANNVFVCTTLLYLSALLSCIYCSSVAFRALLSRLPDGGNLITSLYPQPHSASFDSSGWQYFYILLNVSGRMDQVSTVEKGSKAYKFCVCKCVYSQFVQCSGVLCCRQRRSVITAAVSARFSSRLLQEVGREGKKGRFKAFSRLGKCSYSRPCQ